LEPILSGDFNIAVDTFIIGTHDKYIATIVRDIDYEIVRDLSVTMNEMLNNHDNSSLVIIEKQAFDKNSKKFSLIERNLALKSDLQAVLVFEPLINSDQKEVRPGSVEELIWNGVAGPEGWGIKTLGESPEPVALSLDKSPTDVKRYVDIAKRPIGGIFLDSENIKISDEGCIALIIEAFNFDAELHYGGMVAQYAYQPYVDALYAITTTEFSFVRKAIRQLKFTVFGPDDKVIYSVKIPNNMWIMEEVDPIAPVLLFAVSKNLPEDVMQLLSEDVKSFEDYVRERIEEARKMQQQFQESEEIQESQEPEGIQESQKPEEIQEPQEPEKL